MKKIITIVSCMVLCINFLCSCKPSVETVVDEEYIAYLEEHIIEIEEYAKSIEKIVSDINNELTPEVIEIPLEPVIETEHASAYDRWVEAEMTASERDIYESMYEGWYIIEDEISRGWIDDGTRAFITLLKGSMATLVDGNGNEVIIDISTASAGQLSRIRDTLYSNIANSTYSISDFFMVDEYGNPTSQGIYNFFDAINQLESTLFNGNDIVSTNEYNNITGWDFSSVGGDAGVAKTLGVSEEFVIIIQHAAIDCGFTVNFD